jgi:hypothetical protein
LICGKGPDPDASCGHSEDGDSEAFGLFEFLRMTFGLRNAGNTFQRRMDCILAGLDFVFMYLDDVIIGSCSLEEHVQHLRVLFQRLQADGLVINQEKCVFGVEEVEFLGHHVNATGVPPITSCVPRHLGASAAHNGEGAARVPWHN